MSKNDYRDYLMHYNHNHDRLGRFASSGGVAARIYSAQLNSRARRLSKQIKKGAELTSKHPVDSVKSKREAVRYILKAKRIDNKQKRIASEMLDIQNNAKEAYGFDTKMVKDKNGKVRMELITNKGNAPTKADAQKVRQENKSKSLISQFNNDRNEYKNLRKEGKELKSRNSQVNYTGRNNPNKIYKQRKSEIKALENRIAYNKNGNRVKSTKEVWDKYSKNMKLKYDPNIHSNTTKRVISDYNRMTNSEFARKYGVSKFAYEYRINRGGDPATSSAWRRMTNLH